MSVAFRRESDEEHLEPKFELPLPPGPNLVTRRGLAQMETRAAELEAELAATSDEEARKVVKRQLRYWNTRRSTAIVAPPPPAGEVAFGARVDFLLNGKPRRIDLVGSDEAAPAENRIPFTAPLAAAMIGAEVGDVLEFNGNDEAIEIVAVAAIPEDGA
ncbi:MAG: GreA/GreB family elongation factor [Pseudomonadota bacterium]